MGKKPKQSYCYTISDETPHISRTVKDLEIICDAHLRFVDHINNKINKAYQILGIIKRNYIYLTPHSFLIAYCTNLWYLRIWNMDSVFGRHTMNISLKN